MKKKFLRMWQKKGLAITQGVGAGLILSLLFFIVVTPLRADWVEPGCNPNVDGPDCAGSAPLNVSNSDQTKAGGLSVVGELTARGTLTAEGAVNFPNNAISGTEIADGSIDEVDLSFSIPEPNDAPTFDSLTVTNAFNVVNGPTTLQGGGLTVGAGGVAINGGGLRVSSGGLTVTSGFATLPTTTINGQVTVNGVSANKAYLGTSTYAASFVGPIYTDSSAQVAGTLITNNLNATGTVNLSDSAIQTNEISDDAVTLAKTNFVAYSDTWDPPSIRSGEISTREFTVPLSSGEIDVGDPVILATDKDMRDFVASAEVISGNKVRVTIWLKLTSLNGDLGETRFNLIVFKFQ